MTLSITLILTLAATVATGLLAGVSLDKAIVQLPARHRMGIPGFVNFSRANDLGNGLIVYPALGITAALFSLCAAISAFLQSTPFSSVWPLYMSALLAVLHSAATIRAAPKMLRLRQPIDDEAVLKDILDRFTTWHNVRAILQVLNFALLVWGIVVLR